MSETIFADFDRLELSFLGETRTVYHKGRGPAVLVMHEVPGLHPGVAAFARRLVDRGHAVYMPSLFGTPGRPFSNGYALSSIARTCMMREFSVLTPGRDSGAISWLRELARHAHEEQGGAGVGAVGMCITGGFALGMMVDDRMLAPVLSQPSLPVAITRGQRRDLGLDDETLARVKERTKQGACLMGLRFTEDPLVPAERFARLREELGDAFIGVEIDSSRGNPHGISSKAHSVLTLDLVDEPGHPTREALDRVLDFFSERLGTQ